MNFCSILLVTCLSIIPVTSSEKGRHRQKRFVYFNTEAPIDIGLLVTIPLSFILPNFSKRYRRDVQPVTSDPPVDSYDDPSYTVELDRLTTYFDYLQIPEDTCQQRIICEMSVDPEKYYPISEIIFKRLEVNRAQVKAEEASRFYRYLRAMEQGSGEGTCDMPCPYLPEEAFNMSLLRFWRKLSTALDFRFRDD